MKKILNKQGWISLHRKLLEDPIFLSDKGLRVWIWCLLKASHSKQTLLLGRQKVIIDKGQFITGKNKAKEELNLSISTIWYWLGYLTAERYIERKATNKYTIITVINWEKYQKKEKSCTQSCTQISTQKEPKSVPYNNDNNDNNINTMQPKVAGKKSTSKKPANDVNTIINLFHDSVNPDIAYNNKTTRKATEELIKKYGLEETIKISQDAIGVQGKDFAPVITTPYELKTKLAKLNLYLKKGTKTKDETERDLIRQDLANGVDNLVAGDRSAKRLGIKFAEAMELNKDLLT